MTRRAIPLAGAGALRALARRTTAIRIGGAALLVALTVAAVLIGRKPHVSELQFLPTRSNGIVVLDVSASISTDTYERIAATLTDLAGAGGRYGLVVFSDTAYEALPPGTPSDALRPLIRFFRIPPQKTPGVAPQFPVNPWTNTFSGGTKISAGLDEARAILFDHRLENPAVLLISDLDDDPGDLQRLSAVADAYRDERLPLHVVGLNPSSEDERYFRNLVRGGGSYAQAHLPGEQPEGMTRTGFPVWLVAVALAVALALAANEVAGARLTWRTA